METTELQDKLTALATIEKSAASQRIVLKAHVTALGEAVDNCRHDCECMISAMTKKSQTLLEAFNQANRDFTRIRDKMAAFARDAIDVCRQGVADIVPIAVYLEEFEQKVGSHSLFCIIAHRQKHNCMSPYAVHQEAWFKILKPPLEPPCITQHFC